MSTAPLHVVSVSLGDSSRDSDKNAVFLDREGRSARRGTDGDMDRAIALIRELDGKVDAIGLGGIDLYLIAAGKKFVIRDAMKMAKAAVKTPVVDGSGLKNTLERRTVEWLQESGTVDFRGKKVLLVSAVDRFGMAEALPALGAIPLYGDLIFALGIPIPIRTLSGLRRLAFTLLPIVCRMPFSMLYPTGSEQKKRVSKYEHYFHWADVIAGDFHFINRYRPDRLDGKVVITNTTTEADLAMFRASGASMLVGTTPQIGGRSFGTNVMEGVIIALQGKRPEEMTPGDYQRTLEGLGWEPNVIKF
ncbi:MAG: quinate 5-dehydrogenase [Armatimonadota bacterium]